MANKAPGIPWGRGRVPQSTEVVGSSPQGSESADSLAAYQRFEDRQSPDVQAGRNAYVAAASGGTFDNREDGEPLPIGFPPVVAWNNFVEGTRVQQTQSRCILGWSGADQQQFNAGAALVVGAGIVAGLSLFGKDPSTWQPSNVDSWTYAGGEWIANEWGGLQSLRCEVTVASTVQNVDIRLRWERIESEGPDVWVTLAQSTILEANVTNAPQPLITELDSLGSINGPVPLGFRQRLVLFRVDGGANAQITLTDPTLTPKMYQF